MDISTHLFTDNNGNTRGGVIVEWLDETAAYVDGMFCHLHKVSSELTWDAHTLDVIVPTDGDVWFKIGTLID